MAFSTKAVANYFLQKGRRDNVPLTPMKLQKLIYYAHGWHLAITGKPLIDSQIEAWQYGPVIPELFHELKHFGDQAVTEDLTEFVLDSSGDDITEWKTSYEVPAFPDDKTDEDVQTAYAVLDRTWNEYGHLSAAKLSNMTHVRGGPWDRCMEDFQRRPLRGTDIPEEYIREHFKASLERHLQELQ